MYQSNYINWIIGLIAFIIINLISWQYPQFPVKDENFMIYEINQFSKLGFWGHIQNIKTHQGPLYYYIMGLLKNLFDIDLLGLRVLNSTFSALMVVTMLQLFDIFKINKFYILLLVLNPYFLLLTAPLIYNDNLSLLTIILGVILYIKKENILSIIFFSSAALMR